MAKRFKGLYLVSRLQSELDRAMADAGQLGGGDWPEAGASPPMDVIETDGALRIVLEVPGLEADDLSVETFSERVTVRGRPRPETRIDGPVRFHCMERSRAAFECSVELSAAFDWRQASARLSKGLLIIELPKSGEASLLGHAIEIESDE